MQFGYFLIVPHNSVGILVVDLSTLEPDMLVRPVMSYAILYFPQHFERFLIHAGLVDFNIIICIHSNYTKLVVINQYPNTNTDTRVEYRYQGGVEYRYQY